MRGIELATSGLICTELAPLAFIIEDLFTYSIASHPSFISKHPNLYMSLSFLEYHKEKLRIVDFRQHDRETRKESVTKEIRKKDNEIN